MLVSLGSYLNPVYHQRTVEIFILWTNYCHFAYRSGNLGQLLIFETSPWHTPPSTAYYILEMR